MPIKTFLQGDILTADEVNQFLMDQVVVVFADAAARDNAFGGAGEPVLTEGRFCYISNTNSVQYYDGAQWQDAPQFSLADGIVTAAKIASDAVTTVKILDSNITTAKIADSAITSAKIADGTIVNADINASAAIALSKLATSTAGNIIVYNSSGVPTSVTETGDISISDTGVTAIGAGVIVNNDVSASAAISHSKLANATAGQVLLGTTTTGVVTATTVSGDVTITGAGVTAISSGVIVNADINASAAIDYSKLATLTSGNILVGNASNVATSTAVTGDVTITNAGVTAIGSGVIVNADVSTTAAVDLGKLADVTINTKTADYVLVLTDKNKVIEMNITTTANTVSVPTNASVAFPIGSQITITQYGTGKTQIVAVTPATTNIRSTPGSYLRAQYSSATLIKRATDEWYLIGDLSAS